jgi:hypothetical protein
VGEADAVEIGAESDRAVGEILLFVPEEVEIAATRSFGVGGSENNGGDIELELAATAEMCNAGMGEGGEAVIGGAVVVAPAPDMRDLHGNVGSQGQYFVHEDLHAPFSVPDAPERR